MTRSRPGPAAAPGARPLEGARARHLVVVLGLASAVTPYACAQDSEARSGLLEGPELVVREAELPEELAGEVMFRVRGLAAQKREEGKQVVAIADAGNHRLLFWWPERGRVETFGRSGSGPGEFGSIHSVQPAGDGFMVTDLRPGRFVFVDAEHGQTGTAPRDLRNLGGGAAFLPGGHLVVPTDAAANDPFEFRRLAARNDRVALEHAERPAWFPELASVERPTHPLYEEAGLLFPPLVPMSTDVVVPVGDELVWIEQRTGQVVVIPLGGGDPTGAGDPLDHLVVSPIPESVIGEHVRSFVETRGEAQMQEQHFQAFWSASPDAEGRRALLPVALSTGHPLGWLLEARSDGGLEARVVRLAEGEELPYPVATALPIRGDRFLVGHEGGLTLLVPAEARRPE
jgi:hypothetical protein